MKQIQAWWRIIRFPYNSRREMFRLLTRKIEAAMDAYKDETDLGHGVFARISNSLVRIS